MIVVIMIFVSLLVIEVVLDLLVLVETALTPVCFATPAHKATFDLARCPTVALPSRLRRIVQIARDILLSNSRRLLQLLSSQLLSHVAPFLPDIRCFVTPVNDLLCALGLRYLLK